MLPGDPLVVVVAREDVENLALGPTLGVLRTWVESATHVSEVRGRLQMVFHGFDSDEREVWNIPAVRTFVQALDQQFPYWFYLVDLRADTLKILAFCLSRTSSSRPGVTAIHPADFQAFLEGHFSAMNQLLDHWNVDEDENQQVTAEIIGYFGGAS
jgi:hypothetical protein